MTELSQHSQQTSVGFCICVCVYVGFPGNSVSKECTYSAGDMGLIPELGGSPGEGDGSPLQDPCLENPMDGGAWRAQSTGSQRVGHQVFSLCMNEAQSLISRVADTTPHYLPISEKRVCLRPHSYKAASPGTIVCTFSPTLSFMKDVFFMSYPRHWTFLYSSILPTRFCRL